MANLNYFKNRPQKKPFTKKTQFKIKKEAIKKIKTKFLPNKKIIKIILIGSILKNKFGKYEAPGFRGSQYSDIDIIIFVENNYKIPKWLKKEPRGKPFPIKKLNLAYRNKNFIEKKYDLETFFIRESNMNNKKIQKQGEKAGIPMISKSKNKYLVIYKK